MDCFPFAMPNTCKSIKLYLHNLKVKCYTHGMRQIAIIVENFRPWAREVVNGIAAFAQERRDWILRPFNTQAVSSARLRGFDGIIARILDDAMERRLAKTGIPVVDIVCLKPRAGFASVETDHLSIGRMARGFFASRGFVHFAYCGMPGIAFSDKRRDAFAEVGTHVFVPKRPPAIGKGDFYTENIDRLPDRNAIKKWLRDLPKPIGVFCCNDLRAVQLERVAVECGFQIPRDVAVLGVDDDTMLCSFAEVPLSSIRPNSFKVGYDAARILSAIMDRHPNKKPHKIHSVAPGELVERLSTEFMPVDPPWLGRVLMHIEMNMRRPIGAQEIFDLAERSGTYVEQTFKSKLGKSVLTYITSVKMREAKRLLGDRRLRISEVGYQCGFSSPQYFCRTFTAHFGMSPKAYRLSKPQLRSGRF